MIKSFSQKRRTSVWTHNYNLLLHFYVQQSRTMEFNFWRFIQTVVKLNCCNRKVQLEVFSKNLEQSCNALSRYFQTNWLYTWLLLRKNASCREWYPRSVSLESRCLLSLDLKRTTERKDYWISVWQRHGINYRHHQCGNDQSCCFC